MQSSLPPETPTRNFPSAEWRQIVDSAADTAVIVLDTTGRVLVWSIGASNVFGWSEAEMLDQSLDRLFMQEDRLAGRLHTEMTDALTTGRGGGEEGWRLRKDGSRFWAVGKMSAITGEAQEHTGFVKIILDLTQQERARESLKEERRALELMNRAGAALSRESDPDRLVQIVTDAGVELVGAQFGAFFYNVTDKLGESYKLYSLSGASREAFAGFPMPRNTAVFASTFNGEGIVRSDDITQDPRYGRNAPHEGMPQGHLPVRSYLAVPVVSRSGDVLGGLFFGHGDVGRFTERYERGLVGLAGEAAVAIDNVRLARASDNELAERRRAEAELIKVNSTLEERIRERTAELERQSMAVRQLQKMEAVGQLTGGVAHDFNNLLQVIVGNLELIRRTMESDTSRAHQAIQAALKGARSGAAMTQRLLAFARKQALDPKPANVNALIGGLSDMLHRTLGETVEIETVLAAGLWRAEVDTNELESALLNLAVNARDALPAGGKLTIETANAHVDEAYTTLNPDAIPGQYIVISVTDTGVGMDAATLAQAFEPYFTTKPVGRGTGLGLSQVYGFAKQSGGHAKLYSEPGVGTTVRLYLPRLHAEAASGPGFVAQQPEPERVARGTILVVEDDDDVRQLSVDALNDLGYVVLEASDGPNALRILTARADIDLLFTDVVLPGGLTGAQLAAQALGMRPDLKVLFTTGYARNAIVHHGRLDPGVQLLTKPFSFADLTARIRNILQA